MYDFTLHVGETTPDVGESTLDVGEQTVGETTRRRNDRLPFHRYGNGEYRAYSPLMKKEMVL